MDLYYNKGSEYLEFPWNVRQHSKIEDSNAGYKEVSLEDEQGDQETLLKAAEKAKINTC